MSIPTKTVRYTPYRYSGWRRWWRRVTFRPTESPTYEFEAVLPGTYYDADDNSDVTAFSVQPVGPIRKVDP